MPAEMGSAGDRPPEEIADALRAGVATGLRIEEVPGAAWVRLACVTGARWLAVPLVSRVPAVHAARVRVFAEEHRGHRPGEVR